jgi:TolB-like protein
MRVNRVVRKIVVFFVVMQVAVLFSPEPGLTASSTVAVIPFRMNAEEPIDYIGDGVRDMITSRIGSTPSTRVVKQSLIREAIVNGGGGELTQERAVDIGRALQVDYVIFGSISKIGNNVSIDVNLLDVQEEGTLASVFTQSLGLDELIPHMNILAQGINEAIASRKETPPAETSSAGIPSAENTSGGSSPAGIPSGGSSLGGTPGTESLEDIGTLFQKKAEPDPVVGDGENELELGDAGQLFDTDKPPAVEANGDGEELLEPAEPEESEQDSLTERLLQRKSPIDATDENPAYQKSIDDLDNTEEIPPDETVQ